MLGKIGKALGAIGEGTKIRATNALKDALISILNALVIEVIKRLRTWLDDVLERREPDPDDPSNQD